MNTNTEQSTREEGVFIKALIKIANPTWTLEQIHVEYEHQLKLAKESPDDCEMCSG